MSNHLPTPYPQLNSVLQSLVGGVREALGSNFVGAYLQGSFAVGDFDEHSDCDFIIVTQEELSPQQVEALQQLHERIYRLDIPWAQHLEGSYISKDVVRSHANRGGPLWYLNHGSRVLIRHNHGNTTLVREVLRSFGVTLEGPPPGTLIDPIPVDVLRGEMLDVIHNWGRDILADPEPYNNRFFQTYIVLSYCRMLHDLSTGVPGSKRAGAEWAKANLDPAWHGLINRTWAGRPDPATSSRQRADPDDFRATLEFVAYATERADKLSADLAGSGGTNSIM